MSSKTIAGLGAKQTPNTAERPFGRIMAKIAEKLCTEKGWSIHTNGDDGASAFFEEGLANDAKAVGSDSSLKRFLPELGHNGHEYGIVVSDEAMIKKARAMLIEHKVYPTPPRFITLEGEARAVLTNEEIGLADLHTRFVFQLFGERLDQPVTMVVCWTPDGAIDLDGFNPEITGSSGIAISLAQLNGIPVFNLQRADHLKRICTFIGEPVPAIDT